MDQCDFNEPESTNPSTAEIGVGMGLFNLAWQSEDDGLLVVDLNQPVEMGRGNDGTDDDGETENQH
ncbi:MAG: hypothetical protein RDV00_06030 [Clostridia bacterium]|nr:hypothetical protein [Clostridia bacterium]